MTAALSLFASEQIVTVHVRDHYVVQPTPDGEALPLFTDEAAAIRFAAEAIRTAPTELRLAVVTWAPAALPPLLEHARRAGWLVGADWDVVAGGELAGPVTTPAALLADLAASDASDASPSTSDPIDAGHEPRRAQGVRLLADGAVVVHDLDV